MRRPSPFVIGGGALLVALSIASCLYPSFDEVESGSSGGSSGTTSSGASSGVDGAIGTDGSSSSSSSSTSSSSSSSSSGGDSGNDTGGPIAREIQCTATTKCPVPAEFCCTTIGGPDCQAGTEGFCTTVEGGEILKCDGTEDCDPGQTCCYVASAKGSACSIGCPAPGQELCNGPAHSCQNGKACTGTVLTDYRACQ